jgi:hypothetical protein
VADLTIEEFQKNQARQISRQVIGQCEEHERLMQTNWQKQWETSHGYLVVILRLLDQDFDEACEKSAHPLERYNDDDLSYLVQVRIRTLRSEHASQGRTNETSDLRNQLEVFNEKYQQLSLANSSLQAENKGLADENANLKAHLAVLRQAQKEALEIPNKYEDLAAEPIQPEPEQPLPEWMSVWHSSKTYDRTSLAVRVMGETGKALRPSITKMMARKLSLSEDNSSLDEAIIRLIVAEGVKSDNSEAGRHVALGKGTANNEIVLGLIEVIEGIATQGSSAGGNHPDVLRLTQKGKLAYRIITGLQPKENEYDRLLPFHSTPEHTILNIQAAEILEEGGYQIQGQVQDIRLSNGGSFIPDITAVDRKTGEIIFVEVERDVHKDQGTRKQKWINLYEASNGNLYVFCDNLNCQRYIQGEINIALGGLTYDSYLTNLLGLRAGKRSEKDGSIWLSTKKGRH